MMKHTFILHGERGALNEALKRARVLIETAVRAKAKELATMERGKQRPWDDKPCTQCGGFIFCRILDGPEERKVVLGDGCVTCGLIRAVPGSKIVEGPGVEQPKQPTIEQQCKSPEGRAVAQLLAIAEDIAFPPEIRIDACRAVLNK